MLRLFMDFAGDLDGFNQDLIFVFSCIFGLFLISEFARFFELLVDFVFSRKK